MQAIRMGDIKLLRHQSGQSWELYNIATDPGENDNLAAIYPGIVTRMSRCIEKICTPHKPLPEPALPPGRRYR